MIKMFCRPSPKKRPNTKLLMIATLGSLKGRFLASWRKAMNVSCAIVSLKNYEIMAIPCVILLIYIKTSKLLNVLSLLSLNTSFFSSGHCLILFICPYEQIL